MRKVLVSCAVFLLLSSLLYFKFFQNDNNTDLTLIESYNILKETALNYDENAKLIDLNSVDDNYNNGSNGRKKYGLHYSIYPPLIKKFY